MARNDKEWLRRMGHNGNQVTKLRISLKNWAGRSSLLRSPTFFRMALYSMNA